MALLEQLTAYLAEKVSLVVGKQLFAYMLPDEPVKCVSVQEIPTILTTPHQVDATRHRIRVYARDASNSLAKEIADDCYRAFLSDDRQMETKSTGFIKLPDGSYPYILLGNEPTWDSVDTQKRKVFVFEATVLTKRL